MRISRIGCSTRSWCGRKAHPAPYGLCLGTVRTGRARSPRVAVQAIRSNFPSMDDTSAEAARVVRDAIRRTDPIDRMRQALSHSERMRGLALARLRARHPDLSTVALVEMLLGERLMRDDVGLPGS